MHRKTPSPQSRVGFAGAYGTMFLISLAVEKLAPPSVERAYARPFWKFLFVVNVRNVTKTSPSHSMAMSKPWIDRISFEREIEIGRENVAPPSVDLLKYALF